MKRLEASIETKGASETRKEMALPMSDTEHTSPSRIRSARISNALASNATVPDVPRLATFFPPLRGKANGYLLGAALRQRQ